MMPRPARFGGLLIRKEQWALSLKGKCLVAACAVLLAFIAQREINPFLSVTQPVKSEYLVVEGWIPPYVMSQAAAEFKRGQYRKILIVTTAVEQEKSERSRAELIKRDVQPDCIDIVVSQAVRKDRTYHLGLAVKEWFFENAISIKSLNVATLGPHARRSRLMFEKAFGNLTDVGILAFEDMAYDGEHWWRSSEGVREVLGEVIAYIYARLYFVWT